jgi:hypothetical protein
LAFLQSTLQAVINCIVKSNKCFETNPDAWRAINAIGLELLLLSNLEHYCRKFPDKEDSQEEWRTAVLHDGKYVNLLVGQKTDEDIRVERDEENHYGSGPWDEVTKNYFLAYHQVKAHQRWLALRPNEAEHYCRFQVRTCI